jgi:chaperone protein DnaJ
MSKDYYNILGVQKTASAEEIKSAYRKLAKQFHPDVLASADASKKAQAAEKFKEIQHAYDVLSDPQKKEVFDRYGDEEGPMQGAGGMGFEGFSQGFAQGASGFGDIFSDIFSAFTGGGGRRESRERSGDDIEAPLVLSFKEAAFGVEKELTYQRIERCASCNGTGAKGGSSFKTCTKCGGRGRIIIQQRTMLGMMQTEKICDMCGGAGKIIVEVCPECKGKGRFKRERTVKVKIPAGVDNGQMLTMQNEGSAGTAGAPNGNLIIAFQVRPHPIFEREGADLKMELPISVSDAILGASVEIPTLTSPVHIDVPEGTRDGDVIRIKGRGIKQLRRDSYGDLFVRIVVDVPKSLSMKQKKELKDLGNILKDARYEKIEKYNKKLKEL